MRRIIATLVSFLFALLLTTSQAFAKPKDTAHPGPDPAASPAHAAHGASDAHPAAEAHGADSDEKAEKADKTDKTEADTDAKAKGPTTMRVGLVLTKLNKFEMGPGSYTAEIYVTLRCDHEPCKPDFDVTNGKITGKEKVLDEKLVKEFKVKAELEAFVDLSEFPFDRHLLYMGLIDKNPHLNHYEFDPAANSMDDSIKLAGWDVDTHFETNVERLKLGDGVEIAELQFGFEIRRPRIAAFFKSLVPVFFMVFVAGFTLLLKPKSAAGRLSAATGGLMSVVMFHLSASSSLPPLGYLTRLDKFMIATYLIYMANIAFSVAMVRFEEKKNEKLSELTYLIAGGAVPGIALLAWLTVFLKIA